jgi:hypothetical protein
MWNGVRYIRLVKDRWAVHVAQIGAKGNSYGVLVGKPEGKRPFARRRHLWVDHIKMDLREIAWGGWTDSSGSGYGPVEGSCEHNNEPSGSIKCWKILE